MTCVYMSVTLKSKPQHCERTLVCSRFVQIFLFELCVFLWNMCVQVRTKDDVTLKVKLMIFYELREVWRFYLYAMNI